jgi:gentisate 1,2-dioxygenase
MPDTAQLRGTDLIQKFAAARSFDEVNTLIDGMNVVSAWKSMHHMGAPEPSSPYQTWHWRYGEGRAALEAAARFITAESAGRRIINFRNPNAAGPVGAAHTLLHAFQLVLPGEKAPSHRHTAHALRVIIDSRKAFSIVNGQKTPMETGDVVLTPGGHWHSHAHEGDQPACWIDGLDVPLVGALQVQTFEDHPDRYEKDVRLVSDSPFRFSAAAIAKMLDTAKDDPEGLYGRRVRLEAPTMPTLALYVMRLEGGRKTRKYRTAANVTFASMQGRGTSIIDGQEVHWEHGDVFVVPSWRWIEHRPDGDAQLFSMTDEPLLRFANYHRFEIG